MFHEDRFSDVIGPPRGTSCGEAIGLFDAPDLYAGAKKEHWISTPRVGRTTHLMSSHVIKNGMDLERHPGSVE